MKWIRSIPDPIRGLTLQRLNRQLEAYSNGYIAEFAATAEAMEMRDDILLNVILKRKKAVSRHTWEVLAVDGSESARRHQQALEFFYGSLRCTHALKEDVEGGFNLLVHQMMDATAKGWAVHEITWKPILGSDRRGERRDLLTGRFRFVPLWFFENSSGRLRFVARPGMTGEPLKEREWLVRTGEGLMVPCARAFLFKHLPLQSWLDYCQKFGTPGIRGVTSAARDSAEWNTFAAAMQTFLSDLAVVTNSSESIEVIDLKGHGEAPFAALVERMDRMMAAIWRGADLSTISRDKGYGASLQEAESQLLETDDAKAISETLNNTVDQWVIKYLFGEGAVPKAYIRIVVPAKESTAQDLAIDEFFIRQGVKLDLAKTLERYGRTEAEPGERRIGTGGEPNGERITSGKRQLNDQYL
jgi:phage gp29-like protein